MEASRSRRLEEARLDYIAEQDRISRETQIWDQLNRSDSSSEEEDSGREETDGAQPTKRVKTAANSDTVLSDLMAEVQAIRREQVQLRLQLKEKIKEQESKRESNAAKKSRSKKACPFRVPKNPPLLKGSAENLAGWIQEMEVDCVQYTTGRQRKIHNKGFISQLRTFFEADSLVHSWYVTYVSTRIKARQKLTLEKLTRDLANAFNVLQRPDNDFDDYYLGVQTTTVADYIKRMNQAALKTDLLSPELLKMGFVRGLKTDVQRYVRLKKPRTVARAQQLSTEWENANMTEARKRGRTPKGSTAKGAREYSDDESKEKKRRKSKLSTKAQKALDDLRAYKLNKCYKCGDATHKPQDCRAKSEVRDKWRSEIAAMKEKINNANKE